MQGLGRRIIFQSLAVYGIAATVWLITSNFLSFSFPNLDFYVDISFVIVTAILLYLMLRRVWVMNQAIAGQDNLSHALIENAPDYVFLKGSDDRYVMANKAYVRLVGL